MMDCTDGASCGALSPMGAIRLQRALRRDGRAPIAAEPRGRMRASNFGCPTQMLRRISRGSSRFATRAEPRGASAPFPSATARLENDVALGLAASLWPSGGVVGHCDDRLASLLVLSAVALRGPDAPLAVRDALMAAVEGITGRAKSAGASAAAAAGGGGGGASKSGASLWASLRASLRASAAGGGGEAAEAAAVLRGFIEPPAVGVGARRVVVPNRYDLLDAIAAVLRPRAGLVVRRVFCAIARRLAMDVLWGVGKGEFGTRGGAAAVRIMQRINTQTEGLTQEERNAAKGFAARLEKELKGIAARATPESVEETTRVKREILHEVQAFIGARECQKEAFSLG